jgi:predicted nucleic acid-binding protein
MKILLKPFGAVARGGRLNVSLKNVPKIDIGNETKRLSLADAWIGAAALQEGAILVHKDPEFTTLDCPQMDLSSSL